MPISRKIALRVKFAIGPDVSVFPPSLIDNIHIPLPRTGAPRRRSMRMRREIRALPEAETGLNG
jgi:hypothetical protein